MVQTLPLLLSTSRHALTTGHNIAWNDIIVLTTTGTTSHRSKLDLLEHAGISYLPLDTILIPLKILTQPQVH